MFSGCPAARRAGGMASPRGPVQPAGLALGHIQAPHGAVAMLRPAGFKRLRPVSGGQRKPARPAPPGIVHMSGSSVTEHVMATRRLSAGTR